MPAVSQILLRPSAAPTAEGLVASRCRIPTTYFSNAFPNAMCSAGLVATDDLVAIKIAFPNLNVGFGNEGGIGSQTTIVDAAIEYPIGSTKQRLNFGGQNAGIIPDKSILISDYLRLATTIPVTATFRVWFYLINAGGICYRTDSGLSSDDNAHLGTPGTPATNTVMATASSQPVNNIGTGQYVPVCGAIGVTATKSVVIVGDSISWAFSTDFSATDGRLGLVARGLPSTLAFLNLASSGAQASDTLANSSGRKLMYPYCSTMINALGINDINSSVTVPNLIIAQTTISNTFPSRVKKLLTTLGVDQNTSTDGWITTANQGTTAGQANVNTYNASVRGGSVPGYASFYETSDALSSARDSGIWAVSPIAPTPRTVTDAAITSGAATLTSATASFSSNDVGFGVKIAGAGTAGAALEVYIKSVTNGTTVIVSGNAATTVSGATANIDSYTLDGLHPTPAMYAKVAASGAIDITKIA